MTTKACPECGADMKRDGVVSEDSVIQGPWYCPACGYSDRMLFSTLKPGPLDEGYVYAPTMPKHALLGRKDEKGKFVVEFEVECPKCKDIFRVRGTGPAQCPVCKSAVDVCEVNGAIIDRIEGDILRVEVLLSCGCTVFEDVPSPAQKPREGDTFSIEALRFHFYACRGHGG